MRKLLFTVLGLLVLPVLFLGMAFLAQTADAAEGKTITLGFGATYERCMEMLKEGLEAKGYTVDLKMFDSNELPAQAMLAGDVDGLMQNHLPWIENFNKQNGSDFVMPKPWITYSLISLYSLKHQTLKDFPDGCLSGNTFLKDSVSSNSQRYSSCTSRTSTLTSLLPKPIVILSPTLTSADAFAGRPLMVTLPASQASLATVRLFISLVTFKYLSNLIIILPKMPKQCLRHHFVYFHSLHFAKSKLL